MYKNMIYPTKDIYLGKIESIQDDTKIDQMIAFHQKRDKVTLEVNYTPLTKGIGYYYLKKVEPIKKHMSRKEMSGLLTLTQINQIVARENRKDQVSRLVDQEEVVELQSESTTKEKCSTNYQNSYENHEAKPKVMQYSASHDHKAA